ncbi:hypothetical protein KIN20_008639 [Parelaphostrongylus tenuis]|uniref:Uncharacterized protein n=1 Tax=Parelaphostrongylus tenuis TaxID=148309 RepID=A0AAD5MPB8_PARTN|nr:hypothetical protein KIN20_008639 [Parelaphostrongylus tenuis]
MDEADERNVGPLSTTRLPVERLFTMILKRVLVVEQDLHLSSVISDLSLCTRTAY